MFKSKLIIKTPEQCYVITGWLGIDKFTLNLNVNNISVEVLDYFLYNQPCLIWPC